MVDRNEKWLKSHGFAMHAVNGFATWRRVKDGIDVVVWLAQDGDCWVAVLRDGHCPEAAQSEYAKGAVRSVAEMAVKEMDEKIDALACARGRLVNVMLEADRKEDVDD